jgi:Ca2+-binding EF-hand superfamily protein
VNLARSEDFNLPDAFRVLDSEGKGWISSAEMLGALTSINIAATSEDLYNFIKRFDKLEQGGGRLKYCDFCDAFIPLDPINANKLCRR